MRHLNIFLILLLSVFAVSAQKNVDQQVAKIRETYTDLSKRIEATEKDEESGQYSEIAVNELVVNKLNRSWAAVGNYKVVFRFYYQNREEEPYPTELLKVTKSTEAAARRYYEEFVYDANGSLLFYFEKSEDDEAPLERRVYFSGENVIRVIEDQKTRDKLNSSDRETASEILKRSKSIKQIFINSIE